jgi:hypothetical protein
MLPQKFVLVICIRTCDLHRPSPIPAAPAPTSMRPLASPFPHSMRPLASPFRIQCLPSLLPFHLQRLLSFFPLQRHYLTSISSRVGPRTREPIPIGVRLQRKQPPAARSVSRSLSESVIDDVGGCGLLDTAE